MICPQCNSTSVHKIQEYQYCLNCDWDELPDLNPYIQLIDSVMMETFKEYIGYEDDLDETKEPIVSNDWNGLRKTGPYYPPKKRRKRVRKH